VFARKAGLRGVLLLGLAARVRVFLERPRQSARPIVRAIAHRALLVTINRLSFVVKFIIILNFGDLAEEASARSFPHKWLSWLGLAYAKCGIFSEGTWRCGGAVAESCAGIVNCGGDWQSGRMTDPAVSHHGYRFPLAIISRAVAWQRILRRMSCRSAQRAFLFSRWNGGWGATASPSEASKKAKLKMMLVQS
jgi:hypothetical protein